MPSRRLVKCVLAALMVATAALPLSSGCGGASDTLQSGADASVRGAGFCSAAGSPCATSLDCCSLACDRGQCSAEACTSDGLACASGPDCCSGDCTGGACRPLNTACKTSGNACTQSKDCCSQLCDPSGRCSIASSFCIQNGDTCASGSDCCGGICAVGAGQPLGTCRAPAAGATFCNGGVDGTVCSSCNDCCSRLCAPYAPSGVTICQPAQGCRIDGDLCTQDADCCGAPGTGLPGDGNVHCEIQSGFAVGICRNPTGCNPEGNVCHYKNYACANSSARNDCCGAPGNSGACQLDKLGIPRCHALGACVDSGGACAFDADCCSGGHCVPGPAGALICQAACSPAGGTCTANADCCAGSPCIASQGSTRGVCAMTSRPPSLTCALYGQVCAQDGDCCNQVPCLTAGGQRCDGATGCSCAEPPIR